MLYKYDEIRKGIYGTGWPAVTAIDDDFPLAAQQLSTLVVSLNLPDAVPEVPRTFNRGCQYVLHVLCCYCHANV